MLLFFALMFAAAMAQASAARRRRRMIEEERRRRAELARRGGAGAPPSPFAGLPFGGLLEQMLTPGAGWTRTLEYDEQTGRWVNSAPPPEPAEPEAAATEPTPAERRRQ